MGRFDSWGTFGPKVPGPMSRSFSAALLRGSPSFRRLTGVSVATFDRMVASLTAPWDKQQARKLKSGRPSDLGGLDDHLLVLLIYYRCYVTQEFLGFFYLSSRFIGTREKFHHYIRGLLMAPRGQGAQRVYLDPRQTGPLDWNPWRTHQYSY